MNTVTTLIQPPAPEPSIKLETTLTLKQAKLVEVALAEFAIRHEEATQHLSEVGISLASAIDEAGHETLSRDAQSQVLATDPKFKPGQVVRFFNPSFKDQFLKKGRVITTLAPVDPGATNHVVVDVHGGPILVWSESFVALEP